MGLCAASIEFLIREVAREPIAGRALVLGNPEVHVTLDYVQERMETYGLESPELAEDQITVDGSGRPDVDTLMRLLGANGVERAQFAGEDDDEEGSPEELGEGFAMILDCGELARRFDMPIALCIVNSMLRLHGKIVHITPASNTIDQGFFNISPKLFFDYYTRNEYVDARGYLTGVSSDRTLAKWKCVPHDPARTVAFGELSSTGPLLSFFAARKQNASTSERIPNLGASREFILERFQDLELLTNNQMFNEATIIANGTLAMFPESVRLLQKVAQTLLAAGDIRTGLGLMAQRANLEPDDEDFTLEYARAARDLGDVEGALNGLRAHIQRSKSAARSRMLMAEILLDNGQIQQGVALLEDLADATGTVDALTALGTAYQSLGRIEDALNAFDDAIEVDPNALAARIRLGSTYLMIGNDEKGIEALTACLDRARSNGAVAVACAKMLTSLGQSQIALQGLRLCTSTDDGVLNLRAELERQVKALAT